MKMRKVLSLLVVLVLCVGVLPMSVMAALPTAIEAPMTPKAALDDDVPDAYMDFTDEIIISYGIPASVTELLSNGEAAAAVVQVDWSINSETDWKCLGGNDWIENLRPEYGSGAATNTATDIVTQIAILRSNYDEPKENGYADICRGIDDSGNGWLNLEDNTIYFRLRFEVRDFEDGKVYSDWTPVFTIGKSVDDEITASEWAKPELEKAQELGLIPAVLDGADLTQPITRAEFAAVSVKAYEKLSGVSAIPAVNNPFTDTTDVEVLKAYNTGITSGISADKFDPTARLNREQAATMLTRVFKKVSLAGWSLATDGDFTLPYEKPTAFADDKDISDWAKDSVYFMAANGIITGVGDNKFAPKNVTTQDEATGYANATREQALIIAVRMVENLK